MSSQDEERISRQIEQIEAELHETRPMYPSNSEESPPLQAAFEQLKLWYQGLPAIGQGGVVVIGIITAFSLITTVVKLISVAISLTVLGVLGYLGYKFFLEPASSKNSDPKP